jgi:hypothetical protein
MSRCCAARLGVSSTRLRHADTMHVCVLELQPCGEPVTGVWHRQDCRPNAACNLDHSTCTGYRLICRRRLITQLTRLRLPVALRAASVSRTICHRNQCIP